MRLSICVLAFATILGFGSPAHADIVDTAIEIIKPELKPARPVIDCAIAGQNIATCAVSQGRAELAGDPYVQDIMLVIRYAKDEDWPRLISKVGVTAACTAFDIPGKQIVCDEFAKEVVAVGAAIIEAHAVVAQEVGATVANFIKEGAQLITCAVGFSCPSTAQDPNYFTVSIPGQGSQLIRKYNLDQFWTECYASRVEEGIQARIAYPAKFSRMVHAPVTRDPANGYWAHPDALGERCIAKAMVAQGLTYFEQQKSFHTYGWDPYAAQMNPRWRDMVFAATAELLSDQSDGFNASSQNWLNLRATVVAQNTWDAPPTLHAPGTPRPPNSEIVECVRAVELPAAAVINWSRNATAVGDATVLSGTPATAWAGRVQGWCVREYEPTLNAKKLARRDARDKAIAGGCVRDGAGLICPQPPANSVVLSALGQCQVAYSGRVNACRVSQSRAANPGAAGPGVPAPGQSREAAPAEATPSLRSRLSRIPVIITPQQSRPPESTEPAPAEPAPTETERPQPATPQRRPSEVTLPPVVRPPR
jgi:hypothetical protein